MAASSDPWGLTRYPWEQLQRESPKAYSAFVMYRDLGIRRTLRKVAALYYEVTEESVGAGGENSNKVRNIEIWSSKFSWVQRAEKWDQHIQSLKDQRTEDDVLAMKERHASIAMAAQSRVVAALNSVDPTKMNLLQLLQTLDIAVRNERLARGVPATVDAIVAGDKSPQLSAVSDETLDAKLHAWIAAKDPKNLIEAGEPDGDDEPDGE